MSKRDFSDGERTFYVPQEAYYARAFDDDPPTIYAGITANGGGTFGEFAFRWHPIGDKQAARLEVFDDGWAVLATMPDLIAALAGLDGTDPPVQQIKELLARLGFRDKTPRTDPRPAPRVPARCPTCAHPIDEGSRA